MKRVEELKKELKIVEKLLETREEVLKAIPACPVHGSECVPHAIEWIEQVKTLARIIGGFEVSCKLRKEDS